MVPPPARAVQSGNPALRRDMALLTIVYGAGFLTAVVVRAELGDLRRFKRPRQLSAFAGLNPSIRQSGVSIRGRTRMSKQGNPRVRQALYLAAMTAIRRPNDLYYTYTGHIEHGKHRMSAFGAVMRKLLVMMRAILIHERPYDPDWKGRAKPVQLTP